MADIFDPKKRSQIMAQVKSKDSKPEMIVRKYLHSLGYRFRLHRKDLPGTPDLVLPRHSTIIFVHGCFWHGHEGCNKGRLPKSNVEWWQNKITRNKSRDVEAHQKLIKAGWKVLTVFECELNGKNKIRSLEWLVKNINL